jgi:glycosyltransferase involved in cell wall biosynthesis
MKIGIIGTRGIPNQYGGFEQFAEFVSPELVRRGHEVYVYNSSQHSFKEQQWKGVRIISKYDPENKIGTAGQFIYDFNCIFDSRKRNFDIILQLGYTSSSIWSFLFPKQTLIITNMDGLEWKRSKYSVMVQKFLKKAEKWAVMHSDYLIADSKGIQEYLQKKYNRPSTFIPYGAELEMHPDENLLSHRGIQKFGYNLVIARMEPENNIETIILGHQQSSTAIPLVIIGSDTNAFGKYLKAKYSGDKVQFWGPVYDLSILNSLRFFSNLYFHGHSVGGTNPSLLEAMASFCLIVANDNVFNKAILEQDAFYFTSAKEIQELLDRNVERFEFEYMLKNNALKIQHEYSWSNIIDSLENFLIYAVEESVNKGR